jgi:hypothetical protein
MRKILILLLSCTVFLYGCSTNTISDGTKLYRILSDGKLRHEYFYNTSGMVSKQTIYGIADKKSSETVYIYDSNDRLIKTESYTDVSSSSVAQRLVYNYTDYTYGSNGRLSEETVYVKNGNNYEFASKTLPTYDAAGRVVELVQLSADNRPFNLYRYEYNGRGNVVTMDMYSYDGTTPRLGFHTTYKHDDKRNPYIGLSVMPFSVNPNNIIESTATNHNITPGIPVTTSNQTVIKKYNSHQLPVEIVEYGTVTFIYEYR